MLPLLVALLVAAAPLLRGASDPWAQSALYLTLSAGTAFWLAGRVFIGHIPLPSGRVLAWAGSLALLSGLSAHQSPVAVYAAAAWRVWLAALWVFLATTALSKDQRFAVDEAIRLCGWVLVLLAFFQHYNQRMARPSGSLLNENVLAGAILLLLPLAVQKRDWLLGAGLLAVLLWTRSVGAWLGLSGALILSRRRVGLWGYRLGCAAGFICAVAIYGKFQTPEVANRWHWWLAAARMSMARPWLGMGPGSFAYLLASFQKSGDFSSLYAHQHWLETAAECGLPFALLWLLGLLHCLRAGGPHKTFGATAILIHSLWDYSLSIPANLWLFSYFCASSGSESPRGINVPSRYKLPACLLALGSGAALCQFLALRWEADRLRSRAASALSSGAAAETARPLLARSWALAPHPETARLSAQACLLREIPPASPSGNLLAAAAQLESSAALDPYRSTTWIALERFYRRLGRGALAGLKRKEGEAYLPAMREGRP